MTAFRSLSVVLLGCLVAACGDLFGPGGPIRQLPRELTPAEQSLIEADNRFAFKLFREINAQEAPGTNIFVSPLSVAMALGLTYNDAAGATREAMGQTLEFGGMNVTEVNQAYRGLIDLLRELDSRGPAVRHEQMRVDPSRYQSPRQIPKRNYCRLGGI